MSKRWFDLIATIIFVVFIGLLAGEIAKKGGRVEEITLAAFFGYIIVAFALRRFFYNKEK